MSEAKITILPVVARPTAWSEQRPAQGGEPNVVILPVIRIERVTEAPKRRRKRRGLAAAIALAMS